jgi:protein NEDD1
MEKKVKSSSIKVDDATFARFHPTRKFHLALATYKGSVSVYDLAKKKFAFQAKGAHDAPCREVVIPDDHPDRLFTCGCDSFIKIFDMRKQGDGLQIQSHCGFSTISVSKCGGFFAVGNLKGDLLTYDLRDLKKPLAMTKGDGELITRVAFMSRLESDGFEMSSRMSAVSDELPEPPQDQEDFPLDHILEMQRGRPSDFDMTYSSRVSAISSKVNEDRRGSALFGQSLANAFNLSINIDEVTSTESPSITNAENAKRAGKRDSSMRRRSSFMPSPMQLIREELSDKENMGNTLNTPNLSSAPPRYSSTPATTIRFNLKEKLTAPPESHDSSEEIIDVDAIDSFKTSTEASKIQQSGIDFKKEFEAIREAVHFEVQSLSFDLSGRHMDSMNYMLIQRRALDKRIERIEECLGLLMNEDAKIAKVIELTDENASLKAQLASVVGQPSAVNQSKEE